MAAVVVVVGGRRKTSTWPAARPVAMREEVGWMAWAKRSEVSARVQIVSNISFWGGGGVGVVGGEVFLASRMLRVGWGFI